MEDAVGGLTNKEYGRIIKLENAIGRLRTLESNPTPSVLLIRAIADDLTNLRNDMYFNSKEK